MEGAASSISSSGDNDSSLLESYNQLKCDLKISDYWYKHLSKDSLKEIFELIEKGISNYETCFNDSMLLLCQKINSDKFSSILENITQQRLIGKK